MPSSRRALAVAVVAVALALVVYAVYVATSAPGPVTGSVPSSFTANGRTFVFNYTAVTEAERESGLMNKKVTNSTTMLFAFPSLVSQQFWMYNTNTSLDIIWVNATGDSGTVVYVVTSAQPCSNAYGNGCPDYPSTAPPLANYVIEAKAGFAAANGIEVGTTIQFG